MANWLMHYAKGQEAKKHKYISKKNVNGKVVYDYDGASANPKSWEIDHAIRKAEQDAKDNFERANFDTRKSKGYKDKHDAYGDYQYFKDLSSSRRKSALEDTRYAEEIKRMQNSALAAGQRQRKIAKDVSADSIRKEKVENGKNFIKRKSRETLLSKGYQKVTNPKEIKWAEKYGRDYISKNAFDNLSSKEQKRVDQYDYQKDGFGKMYRKKVKY